MVEVLGHVDFRGLLEVSDVLDRSLKGRGIWRRDMCESPPGRGGLKGGELLGEC